MKRTLKPVFPPAGIEKEYEKRLKKAVREMEKSVVYWLRARYKANESKILDSATDDLLKAFRRLLRQWMRNFRELAEVLPEWFVKKIRGYVSRNLVEQTRPLRDAGLGFNLKFAYMSQAERQVFRAIVNENVNLIKSIARESLTQVEGIVMRAIENGYDLGTLTENLHHQFGVTERRAAMIARDQTAKATNSLSRQRLMDYGVTRGIWMHTSAGKTYRETHVEMDGTEYNIQFGCFDEHEGRAIQPAELVNCHCVCRPVIPGVGERGEQIFGEAEIPETEKAAHGKPLDVTQEYIDNAKPGEGNILFDEGYDKNEHTKEIDAAKFLHDTFGGDLRLLLESKEFGEKMPDYEWNGKLWDFKKLSSEKSADSAIRYGLKQISENPGGLVLMCPDKNISFQVLENIIDRRMYRSNRKDADIIIIQKGKVKKVKRYKNEALSPRQ